MKPSEHIELATIVSAYGRVLVESQRPIPSNLLNRYWAASKVRWGRWTETMKRFSATDPSSDAHSSEITVLNRWGSIRETIEELFLCEVSTRVWAAVAAAWDQRLGCGDGEPIVRSVLVAHTEARCRALNCLLQSSGVPAQEAVELNRLRQKTERWSDMLVGYLARWYDVAEYAADPQRAKDFADDFQGRREWEAGGSAWSLLAGSLRKGFPVRTVPFTANDDLNWNIAATMLDCFESYEIDASHVGRLLWSLRMRSLTEQTQSLIDELCELDSTLDEVFQESRESLSHGPP